MLVSRMVAKPESNPNVSLESMHTYGDFMKLKERVEGSIVSYG